MSGIFKKFGAFQEFRPIQGRNATPVTIWRRKGLLINGALVVILVVAGGVTYLAVRPSGSTTPLQTTAVQQGTVLATVSSSGTLEAAQDLGLNFATGGKVTKIYVRVGQHVKAGQLLARVDPTSSEEALEQAEAQLSSGQAQLSAAEEGETPTEKKVGSDQAAQSLQGVTTAKSTRWLRRRRSPTTRPRRGIRSRPRKTPSPLPSRPCSRTRRR